MISRFALLLVFMFAGCMSTRTITVRTTPAIDSQVQLRGGNDESRLIAQGEAKAGIAKFTVETGRYWVITARASAPGYETSSAMLRDQEDEVTVPLVEKPEALYARAREWARTQEAESQQRVAAYIAAHPHLTPEMQEAIRKKWFALGMTREDVEFSMGRPESRTESNGVSGPYEVWHYNTVMLNFSGGRVAQWTTYTSR